MEKPTIGIAVITYNARHLLPYCLPPLMQSKLKPRILVVNSSSTDGTVELAIKFGVETLVVPRAEFNHGTTRELARKTLGTDIVVMITPDAYAKDSHVLEKLLEPLLEKKASLAYARQIPHKGASFFESFPRLFNYPEKSQLRSIDDVKEHGVYTFFFSDSFGAYCNKALDEIGGFTHVLTGEDTVACAKLLLKGHKVAYVSEAEVHHSHDYTLVQEFRRHFDTGYARETYKELLKAGGGDNARGKTYVKALLSQLLKDKPLSIPYACMQILAKWTGYQLGKCLKNAPNSVKKALSSQDFYWTNR